MVNWKRTGPVLILLVSACTSTYVRPSEYWTPCVNETSISTKEVRFVEYDPIEYIIVGTMVIRFGSLYDPKYYTEEVKHQAAKRGIRYVNYKNSSYYYHRLNAIRSVYFSDAYASVVLEVTIGTLSRYILGSIWAEILRALLIDIINNKTGPEKEMKEATVLLLVNAKECESTMSKKNIDT